MGLPSGKPTKKLWKITIIVKISLSIPTIVGFLGGSSLSKPFDNFFVLF
jgi:hypothetical protein